MMLRRILTTGLLMVLMVAGCDCDSASRLLITDPTDGANLTVDADAIAVGFQHDIVVRVGVLDEGETVRIYPDASALDEDPNAPTPFTAVVGKDGEVTVRAKLAAGENTIVACARDACSIRSPLVRVTVAGGECPGLSFASPAAGTGPTLRLGPSDDQDGTACGAEFATTVRVNTDAPDGTPIRLVVNGVSTAMDAASGGVVDFGNVVLGNRGDTPNTLELVIGDTCTAAFGKPIFVDCDGSSCAITSPSPSATYLNASHDADTTLPGLQLNVTVTSDIEAAGQTTRLIVDGDDPGAVSATSMATGTESTALFPSVTLAEGQRAVQGECKDAAGNVTRSGIAMWTVDTIACGVAITTPIAGQDIGTNDDLDPGTAGIQIDTDGTATGSDCTDVRVSPCSNITGATFETLVANAYSLEVTLGSAPSQEVCAEVRDVAGNIAQARVQLDVMSDAPALTVVSPAGGEAYNRAGGLFGATTYIADLTQSTPECDVAFSVACEGLGENVELVSGTMVVGTASCVASGTSPFGGLATFASIALPTTETSFSLFARQTVGGSTGMSAPIAITGDCVGPSLLVTSPMCGSTIDTSLDTDPVAPGIQAIVTIASPNVPQVDVAWTVVDENMSLSSNGTSTMTVGTDHVFVARFTSAGTFKIIGTAVDSFGNQGSTQVPECLITIDDVPTLSLTAPAADLVVNVANAAANDCAPGTPGLQLQVSATTNAENGSAASIDIGSTHFETTAMGGVISGCVVAPEGRWPVTVTVDDTGTGDGISGHAETFRYVTIDTTPATGTFSPSVMIVNHRIATATLTVTAVPDGMGAFASYLVRCASSPIDTEAKWNAATVATVSGTPIASGSQTVSVGSSMNRVFRTGVQYQCAMRALDLGGNITPLPASNFVVYPQFQQTLIDSGTELGARMGRNGARAIGDIDGDAIPDLLVNGSGAAFLFFGTSTLGANDSPDIIFSRPGSKLGTFAAGLGDFDGDGRNDFAIGDYAEDANRGAVYVFFGRSRADWMDIAPTGTITVRTSECDASLCIRGTELASGARLGRDVVGLGDFDGDGDHDLGIGINGLNQVLVLSGRSGSASPIRIADNPDGFLITGPPTVPTTADFGWGVLATGNILGSTETDMIVLASGRDPVGTTLINPPKLYRIAGRVRSTPGLTAIGIGPDIVQIVTDRTLPLTFGEFNERTSLAVVDFDDDGDRDFAAYDPASGGSLRIFVNDGTANFTNAQSVQIVAAVGALSDFIGGTISSVYHPRFSFGDIDGDGMEDILAGALGAGASTASSAGLIYGRAVLTPLIDWTTNDRAAVLSPLPLASMPIGSALRFASHLGDIDGDGFEDLVVTDPTADGNSPNGRVFLLH